MSNRIRGMDCTRDGAPELATASRSGGLICLTTAFGVCVPGHPKPHGHEQPSCKRQSQKWCSRLCEVFKADTHVGYDRCDADEPDLLASHVLAGDRPAERSLKNQGHSREWGPAQTVKSAIKRSDGLRWPTQYIEPSETTAPSSKKNSAELRGPVADWSICGDIAARSLGSCSISVAPRDS